MYVPGVLGSTLLVTVTSGSASPLSLTDTPGSTKGSPAVSVNGLSPRRVILGGVLSATVMTTWSVVLPPFPSSTVSVIVWMPTGRVTVGEGPVTVPNGPLQVKVSASPSASLEPLPSRDTDVPEGDVASTV